MRAVAALAGVIMSGLAACAPAPSPMTEEPLAAGPAVVVAEDEALLATVEGIDMESRILTLRRTDGSVEKIYVPADVRNLTEVRLGDQLVVSYAASLIAARTDGAPTAVVDSSVMTAPEGSRPGIAAGSSVTTVVTIQDYDPATRTVSFIGPNGVLRTAQLKRSQMQELAGTLERGDQVEVTYSEAAALTIRRPQS